MRLLAKRARSRVRGSFARVLCRIGWHRDALKGGVMFGWVCCVDCRRDK